MGEEYRCDECGEELKYMEEGDFKEMILNTLGCDEVMLCDNREEHKSEELLFYEYNYIEDE